MMKPTAKLVAASILAILLPLAGRPAAQTVTITPTPFQTALDNAGAIINGACIWTYQAGTSTPATTYSTSSGTTNANPIIADSAGRFTAFLTTGASYKFVYEATPCSSLSHGSVLRTADNIAATPANSVGVDITGTAGEAITAGQAVYLSDGSGSKNAGQWYKADSANTYSSVIPEVGIATTTIAAASSGAIRIAGSVSGLSSLSISSAYYIGTAGAITTTAPGNRRFLGVADTATTLILTPETRPGSIPFLDDFRLSLTSGTCVTTADVTAATTLYLTPCVGNRITLFDSNSNPATYTTAEISIAVPATTSQLYDVFAYANSGVPTLELLAWTNDTTRATALVRTAGKFTKSGDPTRLYVGSFRTTTVSGQTENSLTKRFVWNYYNRVAEACERQETTANWTYTTATIRQANAAAANQLAIVIGVVEQPVDVVLYALASNSANNVNVRTAIGLDSTTTFATSSTISDSFALGATLAGHQIQMVAKYLTMPTAGYHTYVWLEYSAVGGTTTWYGTTNSGLYATIWG